MTGLEPLMVAGLATSAIGGVTQALQVRAAGRAQKEQAQYVARQQRQAAGQAKAEAQHRALEANRQGELRRSSIIANAAAQGQSGSESILDIIGGVDHETEYDKALAIFDGDKKSQSLLTSADLSEYQGEAAYDQAKSASTSGLISTAGGLAMTGGKLYNKYKPNPSDLSTSGAFSAGSGTIEDITWNR